jgi:GDP-L-fucose synthase
LARTGKDISIRELALIIKDVVKYHGELEWDVAKPDGMPRKLLDVTRIHSLGWQPTIELNEGISLSYQHYLSLFPNP